MKLLMTIVFMFALFFSITWIVKGVNAITNKRSQDNYEVFNLFAAILLWGVLFYLTH